MPATSGDPQAAWKRLGELLVRRRIQIDPRYRNRQAFVNETGLNYRLVYDIERAKRTNFEPTILTAVEAAYQVTYGSIENVLAGGELTPAEQRQPRDDVRPFPDMSDPTEAYLMAVPAATDGERRALVASWRTLLHVRTAARDNPSPAWSDHRRPA